eukprot:403337345
MNPINFTQKQCVLKVTQFQIKLLKGGLKEVKKDYQLKTANMNKEMFLMNLQIRERLDKNKRLRLQVAI